MYFCNSIQATTRGRSGVLVLLLWTLFLVILTTSCDLLDNDDDEESDEDRGGVSDRPVLISWEEVGTLERDRIAVIYPKANRFLLANDVTFYRLTYETSGPDGEPVLASGAVLLPQTDGETALLSLQRGTVFHDLEAPSRVDPETPPPGDLTSGSGTFGGSDGNGSDGSGDTDESDSGNSGGSESSDESGSDHAGTANGASVINTVWSHMAPVAASAGFATVMSDQLGWGESEQLFPPYLVTHLEAEASLDMLYAARELMEVVQHSWSEELYLTGYSQGGSTTLALLQEIEREQESPFKVLRSTAGGGAYNLESLSASLLEREELGYAPYYALLITAFRNIYFPEISLNRVIQPPYDSRIEDEALFSGEFSGGEINGRLTSRTDELVNPEFRADYLSGDMSGVAGDFRRVFRESALSDVAVGAPLRIYHGTDDDIIPFEEAENAWRELREAGSDQISFVSIEGQGHRGAVESYILDTLLWFMLPGLLADSDTDRDTLPELLPSEPF